MTHELRPTTRECGAPNRATRSGSTKALPGSPWDGIVSL
jgi:hypothetical protein